MKEFEVNNYTYRIKDMNAIELLALQSQVDFSDIQSAKKCYTTIIECFEVKVKSSWLPVKQENSNIYLPQGIENDIEAIEKLIKYMIDYLKEVFQKSNK